MAYSCKGATTFYEELDQSAKLILNSESIEGGKRDVMRVTKQILNDCARKRMISKQEAMVMLGGLDLVLCSETIENVSISSSKRLRKMETKSADNSFITQYEKRSHLLEDKNMYDYWDIIKNPDKTTQQKIPHFVGVNGTPTYPVTEQYARHTLIVFKPWRKYPRQKTWKQDFNTYIHSPNVHIAAYLPYKRAFERYIRKTVYTQPKADAMRCSKDGMTEEDEGIINLCGLRKSDDIDKDIKLIKSLEKGIDFQWDKPPKVNFSVLIYFYKIETNSHQIQERNINTKFPQCEPEEWLQIRIKEHDNDMSETLFLPLQEDGTEYNIDMLKPDQLQIFTKVMSKLEEWMTTKDLTNFVPLRMTICGPGGCGKSVVINTIVTYMRKMFDCNDVVKIVAPTGTAAYNVGGETFHHMLNMGIQATNYKANTLSSYKRKEMVKKFRTFLALIIDERSLVNFKDLGVTEQVITETIYGNGPLRNESWGSLPILILVGDDYQLPSISEGCLNALHLKVRSKMAHLGRETTMSCAEYVMELKKSKRLLETQQKNEKLMARLRIGEEIRETDVTKLLSLHLDNIRATHGPQVVEQIEKEAVYLFFRNEKRIRHNFQQLFNETSQENPVAQIRPHCTSSVSTRGIRAHFNSDTPQTTFIAVGSKVCLENRNFCPMWGLHNGACGYVEEIIFNKNENPNKGHLPRYVVVNFPLYCGPVWDKNNPKSVPIPVNEHMCKYKCCCRRNIPLDLAYARTIHKFQGLTAGPTKPGRPPNMYKCIICDPDDKKFEGTALGLLYTAVSRGTTLGDENGLNSAIYFTGDGFKAQRIYNLIKKKDSVDDFELANKRRRWVSFLNENTYEKPMTKRQIQYIRKWVTTKKYTYSQLTDHITTYITAKQKKGYRKRKHN